MALSKLLHLRCIPIGCVMLVVAGCALPQYQQPEEGERARLRVVNIGGRANTNVFVHPDASGRCIPRNAGARESIALLDWNTPNKGRQGARVGIPGGEGYADERFAEVFVPVGHPLTITFGASVGTLVSSNASCRIGIQLEPQKDTDYEASFAFGRQCTLQVATITRAVDGTIVRTPLPVKQLDTCDK